MSSSESVPATLVMFPASLVRRLALKSASCFTVYCGHCPDTRGISFWPLKPPRWHEGDGGYYMGTYSTTKKKGASLSAARAAPILRIGRGRAGDYSDRQTDADTRAELHRYLGIVFAKPPFVPWPADEAIVRQRRRDVAFEQGVLDRIGRGPEAFSLQEELGAIRAPVLLLWCRDDRVIDFSAADIFERGIARSKTVLLDGCGHMPMMAKPGQVAASMKAFVAGQSND